MDRRYLEDTWARHAGDDTTILDALIARYSEPHRRYHDVEHLEAVWRALDRQAPSGAIDVSAIYLAAAYHDAVYDPTAADNEARSADLAEQELRQLGHDEQRIALVRQLVLDTITHTPTTDESVELIEADMGMLAADRDVYIRDVVAIRQEYAMFDDAQWAAGRAAVLHRMLERPIFRPGSPLEERARANIASELDELMRG